MSEQYEWGAAFRTGGSGVRLNANIDPNVAGRELEKLAEKHGKVTPEQLVQAARAKRHPLHKAFEWDDAIAGEKYREAQAGVVIRASVIVTSEDDGKVSEVRGFVKVAPEQGYKPIAAAMADSQDRNYVLQQFLNQLLAARRRWAALARFAEAVAPLKSIDGAIAQLQTVLAEDE